MPHSSHSPFLHTHTFSFLHSLTHIHARTHSPCPPQWVLSLEIFKNIAGVTLAPRSVHNDYLGVYAYVCVFVIYMNVYVCDTL